MRKYEAQLYRKLEDIVREICEDKLWPSLPNGASVIITIPHALVVKLSRVLIHLELQKQMPKEKV